MGVRYQIEIEYRTGDSFRTSNEVVKLEPYWENYEIADENAERIERHYIYYRLINDSYYRWDMREDERLQKLAEMRKESWYVSGVYSDSSLNLKLDNGTEYTISAFWCGYFESLNSINVIVVDNKRIIH
jgi:predicted metal-dependent hydrolase